MKKIVIIIGKSILKIIGFCLKNIFVIFSLWALYKEDFIGSIIIILTGTLFTFIEISETLKNSNDKKIKDKAYNIINQAIAALEKDI